MRTAFVLAGRELRGGLRGFRILLVSLAIGVATIAAVQSLAAAIETGLLRDGQTILGGDVAVRINASPASDAVLSHLRRVSEGLTYFVELRATARRVDGESAMLVELKGVDSAYPLYGDVTLVGESSFETILERRDGVWGAVADPAVLARLSLREGERLRLGRLEYELRAAIETEPDRLGIEGAFGFAPRIMVDRASLGQTGLIVPGSLARHQYRLRLAAETEARAVVQGLEQSFANATWRIRDSSDPSHRIEHSSQRLDTFLTLVGLTALLMGGIATSNAIGAYLALKGRTIAVLRCLGASYRTLFLTYFLQLLAIAGLGIGLGLAVGASLVPVVALVLGASTFPFAPDIYFGPLLRAASFGMVVVFAFALLPLAQIRNVSPSALARKIIQPTRARLDIGALAGCVAAVIALAAMTTFWAENPRLGGAFVAGVLLTLGVLAGVARAIKWVAWRLPALKNPMLRHGLANLHRPGTAAVSIVLALGVGLTVLVTIVQIDYNLQRQLRETLPERIPSVLFVDVQANQVDALAAVAEQAGSFDPIPYLRARIVSVNDEPAASALVENHQRWLVNGDLGVTYADTPPSGTRLLAGKWWPPDYDGVPQVSIDRGVADAFALSVDDTMAFSILGRRLDARVASISEPRSGALHLNFRITFSPSPLRQAPHTFLATLATNGPRSEAVMKEVQTRFPNISVVPVREILDAIARLLAKVTFAMRGVTIVTLVAGILVVAAATATTIRRRVYESTILKVLGATRLHLVTSFVLEYGLLGLTTGLIATVIGTLAARFLLEQFLGSAWSLPLSATLGTVAMAVALTLAAGCAALWQSLTQPPSRLLHNE